MNLRESFPDAKVFELSELIQTEEVDAGPWRIYVYDPSGFHHGGKWFNKGKMKYPDEEITLSSARERSEIAIAAGREVRICDGNDFLVFHAVDGKVVHGTTFWNQASPNPQAVKVANRLIGNNKK